MAMNMLLISLLTSSVFCRTALAIDSKDLTTEDFQRAILEEQNKYRALHGARPLVVDSLIVEHAKSKARELALAERLFDKTSRYGENQQLYWGGGIAQPADVKYVVQSWYDERFKYDFDGKEGNEDVNTVMNVINHSIY